MKSIARIAVAVLATLAFSLAAVPDDVRQDLGKLVPESIRLLEAKEYATFLQTVVPPTEFQKIIGEKGLDAFAAKFAEKKAGSLLAVLKAIKDVKPKLSEDGNTASYPLPEIPEVSKKEIVFTKIDGRWFIKN